jgi:hypothetical protein
MAIKVGAENKRNVIIAGALFCVVAYLVITQLFGGPSTPSPAPAARPAPVAQTGSQATTLRGSTAPNTRNASQARLLPSTGLDPALHLEKLTLSESIEYAGSGRNIFSGESAPVVIEQAIAKARPSAAQIAAANLPPPPPKPPAIDLRYFGYTASRDGKREAFLLRGDDIFEAAAGEIVNHRYKVVAVDAKSVQITDLSYNNTQTLPLTN